MTDPARAARAPDDAAVHLAEINKLLKQEIAHRRRAEEAAEADAAGLRQAAYTLDRERPTAEGTTGRSRKARRVASYGGRTARPMRLPRFFGTYCRTAGYLM